MQIKNDSLEQSARRFLSHFRENISDSVSFIFSFHCIISDKVKVTHRYEATVRFFLP